MRGTKPTTRHELPFSRSDLSELLRIPFQSYRPRKPRHLPHSKKRQFRARKKKSLLKEAMDPRGLLDAWSETPEAQPHHQNSRSGRPAGNAPRTRGEHCGQITELVAHTGFCKNFCSGLRKAPTYKHSRPAHASGGTSNSPITASTCGPERTHKPSPTKVPEE